MEVDQAEEAVEGQWARRSERKMDGKEVLEDAIVLH
jgi:hypothetical protein